jgi:hypothetical protein
VCLAPALRPAKKLGFRPVDVLFVFEEMAEKT